MSYKNSLVQLIVTLLPAIAQCADPPEPTPLHIQVVNQAADNVGDRLVSQVKEKIRESHSMKLVPDNKQERCVRLIITTADKEPNSEELKGNATIFSAIWVILVENDLSHPRFLGSTTGSCGGKQVTETAANIVAQTDRIVNSKVPQP
ncbi:MAG TPA: hypothetical protein VGM62_08750 [Chthoniobacterales bacterium]|jgi:hypothetical protein